ncbi:hypothetical protein H5410_035335 [Solanum commersonii]|uniref:Uncharacterized protein n=1 Tax=Solanum commersonii TaxID=4109 RepID=A0A9J5Y2L3_SOLCO|nr:hypothetical protein H5410_035335 [Solanum commersonii]
MEKERLKCTILSGLDKVWILVLTNYTQIMHQSGIEHREKNKQTSNDVYLLSPEASTFEN